MPTRIHYRSAPANRHQRARLIRPALIALAAAGVLAPAMANAGSTGAAEAPTAEQKTIEPSRAELKKQLLDRYVQTDVQGTLRNSVVIDMRALYGTFDYEPIWDTDSATELRDEVEAAIGRGLDVAPVTLDNIDRLIEVRAETSYREAAEADIELTTIFIRLASELSDGVGERGENLETAGSTLNQDLLTRSIVRAVSGDMDGALAMVTPDKS